MLKYGALTGTSLIWTGHCLSWLEILTSVVGCSSLSIAFAIEPGQTKPDFFFAIFALTATSSYGKASLSTKEIAFVGQVGKQSPKPSQ